MSSKPNLLKHKEQPSLKGMKEQVYPKMTSKDRRFKNIFKQQQKNKLLDKHKNEKDLKLSIQLAIIRIKRSSNSIKEKAKNFWKIK